MNTKYIHHIHPNLCFFYAHHPPTSLQPWRLVLPSCASFFFKYILIVQEGLTLAFQAFIHSTLIRLTAPPFLVLSLSAYSILYYIIFHI
jgi:hypothetical protein